MKYLLVLLVVSCASAIPRMRGNPATIVAGEKRNEILINGSYDKDLSLENYRFINLYLRNISSDWIRIKSIIVKDVKGHPEFHVINGDDLKAWKRSMLLDDDLRREDLKKAGKDIPLSDVRKKLGQLDLQMSVGGPISLPARLQTERWLLLQLPGTAKTGTIVMELAFADNTHTTYELTIPAGE